MTKPVSTLPFEQLLSSLQESGKVAAGDALKDVLQGVWTTSSEMIGELGMVVLKIRREHKDLSAEQKKLLKSCLQEVRKVYPGFGFFNWDLKFTEVTFWFFGEY